MLVSPMPALLGGIAQWVTDIIESLGYAGIAFLIALENVFPPIPSELILPLSGFMAGQGRFWLPAVIVSATIGSVIGALILYAIGARLGEERLRSLVERYGRFFGVGGRDLDRADRWFDSHGSAAILIGRIVPVVRSLVSVPAGLRRMPLLIFVAYTAIGSAFWNSALIGLGWALGDRWHQVERYASYFEYAVLALLAIGIGRFVWKQRVDQPRNET